MKTILITIHPFIIGLAATTTALMAGLFYAYSCSVSPGLGRLSDSGYVAAMQAINRAIQNPVFFGSFFGAPIFLLLSSWSFFYQPQPFRFWVLTGATALYFLGVLGVTVLGNVPLNSMLDTFDWQTADVQSIAAQRTQFEQAWNRLNTIRTICAVGALVLILSSILLKRS